MSIPARAVSREAVEEARRLYEHTRVPMKSIADLLGISKSTLDNRVRSWGWAPRRARIPHPDRAVAAAPAARTPEPEASAPAAVPRRVLIARLVARIEREIAAVERLVTRAGLDAGTESAADAERAARTLAVLVRSLRELAAMERAEAVPEDEEEALRDADTYRRELAATLERLLEGGEAG